jgi:hypothetical protein
MGDGEAPAVEELRYLGSIMMLLVLVSKNFDDSVHDHHGQNQISADSIHEAAKGYFPDEARCA